MQPTRGVQTCNMVFNIYFSRADMQAEHAANMLHAGRHAGRHLSDMPCRRKRFCFAVFDPFHVIYDVWSNMNGSPNSFPQMATTEVSPEICSTQKNNNS